MTPAHAAVKWSSPGAIMSSVSTISIRRSSIKKKNPSKVSVPSLNNSTLLSKMSRRGRHRCRVHGQTFVLLMGYCRLFSWASYRADTHFYRKHYLYFTMYFVMWRDRLNVSAQQYCYNSSWWMSWLSVFETHLATDRVGVHLRVRGLGSACQNWMTVKNNSHKR